jgi:hypothetical protein
MNKDQSEFFNKIKSSISRSSEEAKALWKKVVDRIVIQEKEKGSTNQITNDQSTLDTEDDAFQLEELRSKIKILRADIEKKDGEIIMLKEGYEASVNKEFFKKFTVLDSVIQEYIDDKTIDFDGIQDIHLQMKEAFAEYNIETFSPALGTKINEIPDLIDERFKKITTTNKEQNATISEVLKAGYRRKLSDSTFQIISKAKVRVYIFEES